MRALRWHGREDLRVEDVPEPQSRPGHVIIEVAWCGICGTDLHEYLKGPIFIPTEPHPLTGKTPPVTLGHEFSGRIVDVGTGVERLAVGDRVTVDAALRDNEDWYCRQGQYIRSDTMGFVGLAADGGLAPLVQVPEYVVYGLPDEVSDEEGALIEPLAVAVHAVRRSEMRAGDQVAIVGAGPIGLVTLAAARAAGAGATYVVERAAARKQQALDAGASHVIDPADGDPVAQIQALTDGGRGVDVSFECVGNEATLGIAVRALRKGGTAAIVGVFEEPVSLHFNDVVLAERTIVGCLAYVDDFPRAIELLADGRIDAAPFITGRVPLEDVIEQGFLELVANKDRHVKILVDPRPDRAGVGGQQLAAAAAGDGAAG